MFKKLIAYCYKNLIHKNTLSIFGNLKKIDILKSSYLSEIQLIRLSEVLKIAVKSVPYYKSHIPNIDMDSLNYEEFLKIPLLTKDIIRIEGDSLTNREYEKKNKAFKNTSGGSTGEPVVFYRTEEQAFHGMANYYYALSLNNVNIYDTSVDLWGAERDMYNTSAKFDLRSLLNNKYFLNTFVLSDEIIADYIKRLNKIKPSFIKAYVHSIYDLAKYINKNKIDIEFKPTIHCTTGPLYTEMREEISKAFNCARVYSFYGSREVSAIATETILETGMSVLFDNVFVEILDSIGNPVEKGEEGEVVITTLNNFYMPLIRYRIGDRAIKGDDLEFGTLRLEKVVGRTLGVLYRKDGSKIDGQFFTTLFFNKSGIKNFQLVQKTLDHLILYLVKSDSFDISELNKIVDRIKVELLGTNVEVIFVDKINLTSTGKIMYVYSEL
ncbi:phenylacetate--CoA ligase family protein [Sphingobacterium multivorum]|uniref:Phenylacetate--CoA ligase family protein n=1 Tax=Sphingobacterium multivorum TaxID=28454 RepID=A0ABX7CNC9_SPHMU|nr:phenylacetate--CoA ligase family protein [Sphingobacterium multivorum]QQT53188.1 phenylacetate--CoA ligase family protein [Sphingobacterium multivorum]